MSIKGNKSDPSPPRNDRCLLLELPRELRDLIYDFALTENGGLIKDENFDPNSGDATGRFRAAGDEAKRDANQLKFVCRQLRAETKGLGLRLNVLTFRFNAQQSSYRVLMHFLTYECSESHLRRVKEVVLITSKDRTPLDETFGSPAFHAYCQKHPSTKVTIRLGWFGTSVEPVIWCAIGSAIHYLLNGVMPTCMVIGRTPGANQMIRDEMDRIMSKCEVICPNVQMFPLALETRCFGEASLWAQTDFERISWISQCRAWSERGFRLSYSAPRSRHDKRLAAQRLNGVGRTSQV